MALYKLVFNFNFSDARIFSALSVLLPLPAVSIPHTENSLSMKAREAETDPIPRY